MKKVSLVFDFATEAELYESYLWDKVSDLIGSRKVISFEVEHVD